MSRSKRAGDREAGWSQRGRNLDLLSGRTTRKGRERHDHSTDHRTGMMFLAHLCSWTEILKIYSACGDLIRLTKNSRAAHACYVDRFQCQN